jgi:hypothetical protein
MTTREERKALRKAKRELRKANKKLRKEKFNEIIVEAQKLDFKFDLDTDDPEFADVFNEIWPVLKPTLEYAELIKITGPKADKVLRTIVDIGHRVSTGDASEEEQLKFIVYLDSYWDKATWALEIIKTFTPEKVDDVIDQVIEVGEWITDNEDDEA